MRLSIVAVVAVVAGLSLAATAAFGLEQGSEAELRAVAGAIVSGGPPRDGIPAIDKPRFVSAADADRWLDDDDVVFAFVKDGVARGYPQQVLVWHEIVNDDVGGTPVAVTYCPLTGSTLAFVRRVGGGVARLGVSGGLVNSNLVMFDRETDSLWPQLLFTAVQGRSLGKQLDLLPVVFTTWGRFKRAFPAAEVLSRSTGAIRAYGKDPYGSYTRKSGYYVDEGVLFPLMHESERFPDKEVFVGVRRGDDALAVRKDLLRKERVLSTRVGRAPVVVIYDAALDDALAYEPGDHSFTRRGDDVVDERGVRWDAFGRSERGEQLAFVPSFNVMWFAWHAFYPESAVVAGGAS